MRISLRTSSSRLSMTSFFDASSADALPPDLHGGGAELLTLEDDRLLKRGPHGRVALDAGVGPHLGERRIDRRLYGLGRVDGRVGAHGPPSSDLDRDRGRDGTDRHHQEHHRELSMNPTMTRGCHTHRDPTDPTPATCLLQMPPRAI